MLRLTEPLTIRSGKDVALRVYPDSRPRNLEIASLQKGLVLLFRGVELIEEGIGFGVPVARYADKTYFPGSAETFTYANGDAARVIVKSFIYDTISRKRILGGPFINDRLYAFIHGLYESAYLAHKGLRPIFDKVMELRKASGIRTHFIRVQSRGRIDVTYRCLPGRIEVQVDLRKLDRSRCEEVVVLNEQGATFFRRYLDTDGLGLLDRQIGAWEKVEADEASFSDMEGTLAFTLKNVDNATLYRGSERVKGRFSWAGFSYALRPNASIFAYTIQLRPGRRR